MKVGQVVFGVFKRVRVMGIRPDHQWEYHGHALTPVGAEAVVDGIPKTAWETRIDAVTVRSI